MRKVLAKNPQVEQQRLHRRVFLDYIDPENQALLVRPSCNFFPLIDHIFIKRVCYHLLLSKMAFWKRFFYNSLFVYHGRTTNSRRGSESNLSSAQCF